jgi:hypothetical protein
MRSTAHASIRPIAARSSRCCMCDKRDEKPYCRPGECSRAVEHCLTQHVPVASLLSARAQAPLSSYPIQIAYCCGPCRVVGDALVSGVEAQPQIHRSFSVDNDLHLAETGSLNGYP